MKKIKRMLSVKFARQFSKNGDKLSVPSIISEGTKLKGNMSSDGIIHIDGNIQGDINCDELIIGIKGSVNGAIKAKNLHLYGVLSGKATVDSLFVAKTAKLMGDATHNSIAIEPGAYIDGHCIRSNAPVSTEEKKTEISLVVDSKKNKKLAS
ncbi:MAG: polymer-forming cytoskeletal protein [Lactobacillus sp.]|jgi:cytoskeletal protein CcmA (bactofilin family)|nr:polymer-forming cytoskeletal protein [Lactobacillus sp.]